jgi:hypothetical protein
VPPTAGTIDGAEPLEVPKASRAKRNATKVSSQFGEMKAFFEASEERASKRFEALNSSLQQASNTEICLFAIQHNVNVDEIINMRSKLERK